MLAYFYTSSPIFPCEGFCLVMKHENKEHIGWEGTLLSYQLGMEKIKC